MEERKNYNSIFKASALFGGVQLFQVLIQLIRSKIVAVLLGPTGLGILGLFNGTITLLGSITNLGLNTTLINEISSVENKNQEQVLSTKIYIFKKTLIISGLIGLILMIGFSSLLSDLTFGNYNYKFSFIWLSFSLLLNQLTSGNLAILQGYRFVKLLAKANIFGSVFGLIFSIPLYYFWGKAGIVSSITLYAISTYLFSWFYTRRISSSNPSLPTKELIRNGLSYLSVGLFLGLSSLVTIFANYLISLFIARFGSVEELGLYSAGIAITTNYTGLIFSAFATDYHPRLASLSDSDSLEKAVNQQAEIALIILSPLIITFLVFGGYIINILYSNAFIMIKPMICWILLGAYFKLFSWAISFVFIARGKIKLFFWNELTGNIYVLVLGIAGFYFFGLVGLGYSFLISYIIYSFQVSFLARKFFGLGYKFTFVKSFVINLFLATICFLVTSNTTQKIGLIAGSIVTLIVVFLSYLELNRKVGLKHLRKF